jgi:hypothetical protein
LNGLTAQSGPLQTGKKGGVRFKTNIDVNDLQLTTPAVNNCNEDKEEKPPVMKKTETQSGQIKE